MVSGKRFKIHFRPPELPFRRRRPRSAPCDRVVRRLAAPRKSSGTSSRSSIRPVTSACGRKVLPGPRASSAVANSPSRRRRRTPPGFPGKRRNGSHSSPPTHRPTPTTVPCTRTEAAGEVDQPALADAFEDDVGQSAHRALDFGRPAPGPDKSESRGADGKRPLLLVTVEIGHDDLPARRAAAPRRRPAARSARRRARARCRPASARSASRRGGPTATGSASAPSAVGRSSGSMRHCRPRRSRIRHNLRRSAASSGHQAGSPRGSFRSGRSRASARRPPGRPRCSSVRRRCRQRRISPANSWPSTNPSLEPEGRRVLGHMQVRSAYAARGDAQQHFVLGRSGLCRTRRCADGLPTPSKIAAFMAGPPEAFALHREPRGVDHLADQAQRCRPGRKQRHEQW